METEDINDLLMHDSWEEDDLTPQGPKESVDDTPSKYHLEVLKKYFGHSKFRPLQWKIIDSVMNKRRDNCIVMATGYGKSLCYQYPAVFKCGLSVVISPLISLMEDQVQALEVANIPACFLGSAQTKKSQVLQDLESGSYRLVYLTPEYASGEFGLELLKKLDQKLKVTLLAIDEAHCISQWGHDFRPAYRNLKNIRKSLPNTPILAVTATATETVRNDLIKALNLRNPQVLSTSFDRPNLYFMVEKKTSDEYSDIYRVLNKNDSRFNIAKGSTIIYCITKKVTDQIVHLLNGKGINCAAYHAGLTIKDRKSVHDSFVSDEIKVIVATIAFGMGIDKPNVRCVIHYGSSSEMEGYYQEAGRAGRDGNPSLCFLYHSPSDFTTHGYLREKSYSGAKFKTHKESLNAIMKQYISVRTCRRHFIMSYFDNALPKPDNPRTNCCDNCTNSLHAPSDSDRYIGIDSDGLYDFSEDTEKFLKAIQCFQPRSFGIGMLVGLLRGSKIKKLSQYFNCEAHGIGSSKNDTWWKEIAQILQQENYIKKEMITMGAHQFPVYVMLDKGEIWMKNKQDGRAAPIMLPPTVDMMPSIMVKRVTPKYISCDSSSDAFIKPSPGAIKLSEYDQKLLNALFDLRHQIGKEKNLMPHIIASDVALYEFASKKPTTKQYLYSGKFDGMSDTKIEKFGEAFVNKIKEYLGKNPQPSQTFEELLLLCPPPPSTVVANFGGETQRITLDMIQQGKSLSDIAESRKLAPSTIINHIASALRFTDKLDLAKFTSAAKILRVIEVLNSDALKNDTSKLAPIKKFCPPAISYDDLKLAIAYKEVRDHLKSLNVSYKDNLSINVKDKTFVSELINDISDTALDVKDDCVNVTSDELEDLNDVSWVEDGFLEDLDRIEADENISTLLGSNSSDKIVADEDRMEVKEIVSSSNILSIDDLLSTHPIPPSKCNHLKDPGSEELLSMKYFLEGQSLEDISILKDCEISTIVYDLARCLRSTDKIDLSKLIDASKLILIMNVIDSKVINNDISLVAPIKKQCPPEVSYNDIRITIAYVELRDHLKSLQIPFEDKHAIDLQKKVFINKKVNTESIAIQNKIITSPESDDSENNLNLKENIDLKINIESSSRKKKLCISSDSEEKDDKVILKRKLPDWLSNNAKAKTVMKAKMAKNSLFN